MPEVEVRRCRLCLVAPLLIPLVYGQKWQSSVPLVQLLCALGLVGGVSGPTQLVRTALGHVRFNFHWTWITGIAYGLVMWAAASSGLMGIVLARTALVRPMTRKSGLRRAATAVPTLAAISSTGIMCSMPMHFRSLRARSKWQR